MTVDLSLLFGARETPSWGPRFASKVTVDDDSGCWLWHRVPAGERYAQFWLDGRKPVAHRLLWEYLYGHVPDGVVLDHLCRVRHCLCPAHLDPVTQHENTHRSPSAPAAIYALRTHCDQGHEFTEENTRWRHDRRLPSRRCRTCANVERRQRASRASRAGRQTA